jgi:folate-binding protein YgfZ
MPTETPTITPANTPAVTSGLAPLLTSAGFAPGPDLGFLRVTGEDRVRWLNGMCTNSIQALQPGEGCYTFFLNAQGRIQADATAWLLEDAIFLETQRVRIPALIAHLDHFIIMDDVELTPVETASLLLAGPSAAATLAALGLDPTNLAPLRLTHTTSRGAPVDLLHAHSPLVPRFELWSTPQTLAAITEALTRAGIPETAPEALNQLRLLEGTPLYATDIRDRDLPQETAQTHALHFAKGCYLGQEIVERIRSRGNVHRTLHGFVLTGDLPTPPPPLFLANSPDKPIGELTSAARIDLATGPITLALGTIRREALETKSPIAYATGSATPTTLPYRHQEP